MALSVTLTQTNGPESISPLYTDGIGNWFEFQGSITGGASVSINDANLIIDVRILNQFGSTTSLTVIDTPGRFKVPCREGGKFIFNSENIIKNYVTYPYNYSTKRYYNGLTSSGYELVADPYVTYVSVGTSSNANFDRSAYDFLYGNTYSILTSIYSGNNLKAVVPLYGTGLQINILTVGAGNRITSSSLAVGGSGYSVGETFTVSGGSSLATGVVDTIGAGGNVLTYTITGAGLGYTALTTKTTTATSPRDNYLDVYGVINGVTSSNIFQYPGLYGVKIEYVVDTPASGVPMSIDFTLGSTTITKTHSTAGSYSFSYDYNSIGGSVGMGLKIEVSNIISSTSSFYYMSGSVQPCSLSSSVVPLYINEATPVGSTATNYPNFAYEPDSYVRYNMEYGLEFNPNQDFLFISSGSAPYTSFCCNTADNSVQVGDIISTLPDSTIFSYFSTTGRVLSITPAGPYDFIKTDLIWATPSASGNVTGKITNIQRQIGTTSTLIGYNGVRDYFMKETAQVSPYNSILMNKYDMRDNANNSFLSNYGYDEDHAIPIKAGQGERVRLSTDFMNNTSGGSGFQIQVDGLGTGNSIATYSISNAGSGYVVGQIIRVNAGGVGIQANAWITVTSVNGSGGITGTIMTDNGLGYVIYSIYSTTGGYMEQDAKYVITMIDKSGNETVMREQIISVQNPIVYNTGIYTICMFDENNTIPIYDGYKYRIDYYAFRFQPFASASLWYIGVEDCSATGYVNTRIKFLDKNGTWAYCNFNKDLMETNNITRNEYRIPLSYDYSLNPAISGYSVEKLRGTNIISVQEQKTFVLQSDWVDEDYYAYLVDNLIPTRQAFMFYDTYTFVDGSTASAVNIPIILTLNSATKRTLNRNKIFNITLDCKYGFITNQNI